MFLRDVSFALEYISVTSSLPISGMNFKTSRPDRSRNLCRTELRLGGYHVGRARSLTLGSTWDAPQRCLSLSVSVMSKVN